MKRLGICRLMKVKDFREILKSGKLEKVIKKNRPEQTK